MESFLETILRLDADNNFSEIVKFIQSKPFDSDHTLAAILELLSNARSRSAFILSMLFNNNGFKHPVISATRSLGGLIYNNPGEKTNGLKDLNDQKNLFSDQQWERLYERAIAPTIMPLIMTAVENSDNDRILHILAILKVAIPRFKRAFGLDGAEATFSLEKMRQQGQEKNQPITYPLPPSDVPRQPRRVVVVMRESIHPSQPEAGSSDFGPRIVAAMNAYGWRAKFYGIKYDGITDDGHNIAETCRREKAEIIIVDDDIMALSNVSARSKIFTQLQQEMPALKWVGAPCGLQPLNPSILEKSVDFLDVIFNTTSPSLPFWKNPIFDDKVLHVPMPHGGNVITPKQPLRPKILCIGSADPYNGHHAFWHSASDDLGLPIEKKPPSEPQQSELSPLENYARKIKTLSEATCCLNFITYYNQTDITLSCGFDVILSGSLLVQESTPDMHRYFIAGEHYLEFSTLAELSAITRFITENREEAEKIRHRGHAFAQEHYSDERRIAYLDKRLYFPKYSTSPPSFRELTRTTVPLKIVDVGANPIDSAPPYMPLMKNGAEIIGFEPNLRGLAKLNAKKGPKETYLPYAVGDGKRQRLNFCRAQGMTSLLTPNPRVLNLFFGFSKWGQVVSVEEVDTVRLDDIPETVGADLLKMDIQGAELLVLRHATERLRDLLVIQVEVEFMQMYIDQPLFSDVELFLRAHGFLFHRFFPTVSRVIQSPKHAGDDHIFSAGMSQLVWADAIFVRDYTRLDVLSDRDLLAMAMIMHDCYQSFDLALHLLNEYDKRTGSRIGRNYISKTSDHWPHLKHLLADTPDQEEDL